MTKAILFEYEQDVILVSQSDSLDIEGRRCWSVCVGTDNNVSTGVEIVLSGEQMIEFTRNLHQAVVKPTPADKKDTSLLVDCSYHEGSYLVEKEDGPDIELSGYEFYPDKPPLRFFHIKRK